MIRVLHISSEKAWRGGEQQIAYLIRGAEDIHHFVFCRKESAFEKYCIENEIHFQSGSFSPWSVVTTAKMVIDYCLANAIELVHCHTGKAHILGYAGIKLGLDIPVIASRRIATRPSASLLTRKRYDNPQIRRIICVSESIRVTMAEYLTDPVKAVTIHSGIDTDRIIKSSFNLRKKLNLPDNTTIIGTIAALTEEKDLPTFLKAAQQIIIENDTVHFLIVGEGKQRETLEKMARDLAIEKKVTFTGHVNKPIEYLQEFNQFLFTSRNEGLGTSILDAFACKVPVIASDTGGIPELIRNGETGLLVAPGDSNGFARAVNLLLNKEIDDSVILENAWKSLKSFSYKMMAKKTEHCYQSVLNEL